MPSSEDFSGQTILTQEYFVYFKGKNAAQKSNF